MQWGAVVDTNEISTTEKNILLLYFKFCSSSSFEVRTKSVWEEAIIDNCINDLERGKVQNHYICKMLLNTLEINFTLMVERKRTASLHLKVVGQEKASCWQIDWGVTSVNVNDRWEGEYPKNRVVSRVAKASSAWVSEEASRQQNLAQQQGEEEARNARVHILTLVQK